MNHELSKPVKPTPSASTSPCRNVAFPCPEVACSLQGLPTQGQGADPARKDDPVAGQRPQSTPQQPAAVQPEFGRSPDPNSSSREGTRAGPQGMEIDSLAESFSGLLPVQHKEHQPRGLGGRGRHRLVL